MERVVPLQIQVLVSVGFIFVDLKLRWSVIPPNDVYIQYWQVLMVLFILLELYMNLILEFLMFKWAVNSSTLSFLITSTISSMYQSQVEGQISSRQLWRASSSNCSQKKVLHISGLMGLPMGKPVDCWYRFPLEVKMVVSTTKFKSSMRVHDICWQEKSLFVWGGIIFNLVSVMSI